MTLTTLELVAAVAANGVIGKDGQLPWHLPDDLRHFKKLTLGHAVIMGRKTFESIGRPLPGRRSIVVSSTLSNPLPAGIELARSLEDSLGLAQNSPAPAFAIGGSAIYSAAIPYARAMHLTELDEAIEGDAFFPLFDKSQWRLTSEVKHPQDANHAVAFRFCRYERAAAIT